MTVTYVIEGSRVTGLEQFWTVIGESVNGPGGYFGRNLDALADCLGGGMGTPDDGDFAFEWRDHASSARALGHEETARYLRQSLSRAHPTNRASVQQRLDEALAGRGPTLFDLIVAVLSDGATPGTLLLS
ncbi:MULTISPECIES: barstar family protein [unclassified Streptomyces]|uniref:barstar family protein n=1 Tax=unclassified Streptomyces TaxID=2593676 RepID=UPI000F5BA727|nr:MULTISPECIES: barstar family protein [unclassified Streptomyces]WSG54235.1 barstar family protein [Streptomyces sp. NBC_01732]WSX04864.1 barstar family protein [Streptomyces sp. NBC_00987]MCX4392834.1 barstar family protein [Streptomyces sp. NBC_01767]MCX5104961.1 barstar family protein [Streptomyces sp. NBC_00439]MCX5163989.1 barstar family protein [Streptomyces sp. NBC_00305]